MKTLAVFIILYSVKIDSIFKSRVPFIFLKVKRLRVDGCLLATKESTLLSGDFTECTMSSPCKSEKVRLKVHERLNAVGSLRDLVNSQSTTKVCPDAIQ